MPTTSAGFNPRRHTADRGGYDQGKLNYDLESLWFSSMNVGVTSVFVSRHHALHSVSNSNRSVCNLPIINDSVSLFSLQAPVSGILAWKVGPGDFVEEGQLLGEVVNMEDPFAARTPIVSRTAGK